MIKKKIYCPFFKDVKLDSTKQNESGKLILDSGMLCADVIL